MTNQELIRALQAANARGVDVQVLFSEAAEKVENGPSYLRNRGIRVWIQDVASIKDEVLIVDDKTLVVGSLSKQGHECSSAIFLANVDPLAQRFGKFWDERKGRGRKYLNLDFVELDAPVVDPGAQPARSEFVRR